MLAEWSAMNRGQNDVKIDRPTWIFPLLWQINMCTTAHTRMQERCVWLCKTMKFKKQWKLLWFSMRCPNFVDILYVLLLQQNCTHMLFLVRTKQRIQIPRSREYLCREPGENQKRQQKNDCAWHIYVNHVSHIQIFVRLCSELKAVCGCARVAHKLAFSVDREKFIHTLNLQANYHNIFRGSRDDVLPLAS